MTGKALVIGYGNPLRGDDGLGWYAAQELERILSPDQAEILICQQLSMELTEAISKARLVIFIDVSVRGHPGEFSSKTVDPEPSFATSFSHHLSPARLLTCAQFLYKAAPRAIMLSVAGEFFGYKEGLSVSVLAAVPKVIDQACMLINQQALTETK